jgi:thiamine pyrophosphate-dependent acetolactate synthase large subunit-like protein
VSESPLRDRLARLSVEERQRLLRRLDRSPSTGSQLAARALAAAGITRVFTVAGTPVYELIGACAAEGIRVIGTRQQTAAVLMAAAGNHVAGRTESAVIVSAGPGVTQTLTGLLTASDNRWPVLVLGGRRALAEAGEGQFQELDALPIVHPLTRSARAPRTTQELADAVLQACAATRGPIPGPAYLDLAEDILNGTALPSAFPVHRAPSLPAPGPARTAAAARLLRTAARPLLILGDDLLWSDSLDGCTSWIAGQGIPFITTSLARGILPDDHPLCANAARHEVQAAADTVLALGAPLDWRLRFGGGLDPAARVVVAGPSGPRGERHPAHAIRDEGDPAAFCAALAHELAADPPPASAHAGWRQFVQSATAARRNLRREWMNSGTQPIPPAHLFATIARFLTDEHLVTVEGHVSLAFAQHLLTVRRPRSWIDPGWSGLIGGALPCAMGAALAHPGRPVLALCSDTGFGLSGFELETAARHHIPVTVVIANNDGNTGTQRQRSMLPPDYERVAAYQPGLRYDRMAAACGVQAHWVTRLEDLMPALEQAAAFGGPACVNVQLDSDASHPGFW